MKLLDQYFNTQQEIYDYFGFKEGWAVIPLDDCRKYYWCEDGRQVVFTDGNTPEEAAEHVKNGGYYSNDIYTTRHLSKYVYRGPEFTMIVVDTHTDGNKFLSIYDNSKEIPGLYDDNASF